MRAQQRLAPYLIANFHTSKHQDGLVEILGFRFFALSATQKSGFAHRLLAACSGLMLRASSYRRATASESVLATTGSMTISSASLAGHMRIAAMARAPD